MPLRANFYIIDNQLIMVTIFDNIDIKEIEIISEDKDKILKFLAENKWKDGFECRNCGHTNYCHGKTPYSRRCTKCKKEESATAHTLFHRCRFDLKKAFKIAHMVCTNQNISTYKISEFVDLRQMTCWSFKKKITECINNREDLSTKKKIELKDVIIRK